MAAVQAWPTILKPSANDLPPDRPGDGEDFEAFLARHYRRHPGQLAFLTDPARYRFACSGVGGGKSEVGAFDAVVHCLRWPGIAGLVVSPSYRMLNRSTLIALRKVLRWWGDTLRWEHHKSENSITFPEHVGANGEPSTLFLAHCQDPDTLRGPDVGFFFGDEAALYREETWQVLLGRTRQPGYPHRGWVCSTPKGLNWLHRTFVAGRDEWTDERRANYGFHHWSTDANPLYLTDPDFLAALAEAYGPGTDFYRQEVQAEFVSFAGLVYRNWNAATMIVAKSDLPTAFDRIVCGVDWGVTSPGCFIVLGEADGVTYLLEEVYERGRIISGSEGNDWLSEALELRKRWAQVKFLADPSDANAIETFLRAGLPIERADNKRIPGVRACQAAIAGGKFRVVENAAPNWQAEVGQYHWQEDRDGKPKEDADPAKEFDHCLVAGTLVETEVGPVPIEAIMPGDRVLTRDGYRAVVASGMTRRGARVVRLTAEDGGEVIGTPTHPICTGGDQFVGLDTLRPGDTIVSLYVEGGARKCARQSSSTVGVTAAIQAARDFPTAPTSGTEGVICTGMSTSPPPGRYRRAKRSIILMGIQPTTIPRTWRSARQRITTPITGRRSGQSRSASVLRQLGHSLPHGIALQRGGHGTANTPLIRRRPLPRYNRPALTAGSRSSASVVRHPTAPAGARRHSDEGREPTTKPGRAQNAEWHSLPTASLIPVVARSIVLNVEDAGRADVYNLTVEGSPEYFANGVLVHNCMDAWRYAQISLAKPTFSLADLIGSPAKDQYRQTPPDDWAR